MWAGLLSGTPSRGVETFLEGVFRSVQNDKNSSEFDPKPLSFSLLHLRLMHIWPIRALYLQTTDSGREKS